MRWSLLGVLLLAGCGGQQPAPPAATDVPMEETPPDDGLVMQNIEMHLYDSSDMDAGQRMPSLSIEAARFVQEDDKQWRFEEATATARRADSGADDVVFTAARGELREEESAYMHDGVRAVVGSMTIDMEDVAWQPGTEDRGSLAYTEHPVSLADAAMELYAQQFRMYPEDQVFALYEVNGWYAFPIGEGEGATEGAQEGAPQ